MPKLPVFEEELVSIIKSLGLTGSSTDSDPTEEIETGGHEQESHRAHSSAPSGAVTAKNLFHHPDTHPLILDLALLRRYGADWYPWEPETLEHVIPKDFGVASVSHVNLGKIQACKTLHLVDSFWERWEVFSWCTMALNGVPPDFEVMQVPSVIEAAIAVDIANRIRMDVPWSTEVHEFLKQVLLFQGILHSEAPLDFLDYCPREYFVDCAEIDRRWPEVRRSGKDPTGETVEDEQLRRLLQIDRALDQNRTQLRDQLEILKNV